MHAVGADQRIAYSLAAAIEEQARTPTRLGKPDTARTEMDRVRLLTPDRGGEGFEQIGTPDRQIGKP